MEASTPKDALGKSALKPGTEYVDILCWWGLVADFSELVYQILKR